MTTDTEPVLGIDLGTTNSACAVVRGGRASVVRRGDDRIIPSVVAAMPDGRLIVGNRAKQRRAVDPAQVVFSSKRLIGRRFGSPEVQRMLGVTRTLGPDAGLPQDWALQAIKAVGNYGEIFDRSLGEKSAFKMKRGVNDLAIRGGLIYGLPIR